MTIHLSSEEERLAQGLVDAGRFESVEEVVLVALKRLQQDAVWLKETRDQLTEGVAAADAGDFVSGDQLDHLFASYRLKSA